jgi:hypothetical protein
VSSNYWIIVNFETEPGEQDIALGLIGNYIETFLSQQPGFIQSRLHKGTDGTRIVHCAEWKSEEHFRAFAGKAASHPDLPEIRKYKPDANFFEVWKQY